MQRYICIHGHFYQPPRENAWLESIELQDSAYPYHDWNARITAECYRPNTASHILDGDGRVKNIVNNYAHISYNFGPTLLAWMEAFGNETYQAILEADKESMRTFAGHGSAMAQCYNHLIMPLANSRDKSTQIYWGMRDFEHRFGRKPEGMWLPETAVDTESLDLMAAMGIRFTVLAPSQAKRVRKIGAKTWTDVDGEQIDPKLTYTIKLPSGRSMALFFYDGPIAKAVAFENLLIRGEDLAGRLVGGFSDQERSELVHIATDGETYGHHHRFGDMALAYALDYIAGNDLAKVTNYSQYLNICPPAFEVEIKENTSWSCVHGIERWRSNCGCNTGMNPGWNQEWRAPLREALDWLRDAVAPLYEEKAAELLKDPWKARDEYVSLVLDRSPENVVRFFHHHATRNLDERDTITGLKLLELQRHAMLMFTSCGWFFDELSGIETVQVMQYAGRVVQLAEELSGSSFEPGFLGILEKAQSNLSQHGNGRNIYENMVKPAIVDLIKVGAHFAVSSIFEDYGETASIYCYTVNLDEYQRSVAGRARLSTGRCRIASTITTEAADLTFGVLHFGDQNLSAGVRYYQGQEPYEDLVASLLHAFSIADLPEVLRKLDQYFGQCTCSLRSLFRDEQRKVITSILGPTLEDLERTSRQIYDYNYPLMRYLMETGVPVPSFFMDITRYVLESSMRRLLGTIPVDVQEVDRIVKEIELWKLKVDAAGLSYQLGNTLEEMIGTFAEDPEDLELLGNLVETASLAREMTDPVDLWKVQNIFYEMIYVNYPSYMRRAHKGDKFAQEWRDRFLELGETLAVCVP